jgi:hypothetical protein
VGAPEQPRLAARTGARVARLELVYQRYLFPRAREPPGERCAEGPCPDDHDLHRIETITLPGAFRTKRAEGESSGTSVRWLAPEVCEHREHAAVRLWVDRQSEFEEHLLDVRLDGALRDE